MGVLGILKRVSGNGGVNSFSVRKISTFRSKFDEKDGILPVLIVGGGPVGLFLSALLTQLGVRCAVFRKVNGLAEEIQKLEPPVDMWRKFIYCTSLSGSIIGSVDHMQPQDFNKVVSPVSVAHFSQHKLTRLLVKHLEDLGFSLCIGDGIKDYDHEIVRERMIMMGHECTSIEATDHCVMVCASFLKDGRKMERKIRCNILVGTDGAGSMVRKLVGIDMMGENDLQKLISVHFSSRELGQYLLNERPGMLFFIFNVDAIGVLVAHDLKLGEFVLQIPFYPPQQSVKDFNPEVCRELISKLAGRNFMDVDVIDVKPWVMHAEVAEKFISCDNRVILAGDAAHRFPPAGGFGMNTGIQDAHNLAWKIASLFKGISPPSILQTYEIERLPIALFNTELSVQNFKAAMSVPAALGLNPNIANSIHQVINKVGGSILPSGIQRTILDGIFAIGRYTKGALVPETDKVQDTNEVPLGRRRDYIPSAEPGSRLPHMNVIPLNESSTKTFSTLDLIRGDDVEFLLIIAPKRESYNLAQAAFKAARRFKVPLKVSIIWPSSSSPTSSLSKAALHPWENYIDVREVSDSNRPSSSWWEICKMADDGAILVRPDEHVAWRAKSTIAGDPVLVMDKVFSQVLGVEQEHHT
ncbi:hypothetical protein Sjap_023351 [Stephania japonica]|uniref:FAD-binding domain-containing protein n=1 Tax=Stephania japonica TaxID=461633 RepID=A0AAP0EJW4_9MAGN